MSIPAQQRDPRTCCPIERSGAKGRGGGPSAPSLPQSPQGRSADLRGSRPEKQPPARSAPRNSLRNIDLPSPCPRCGAVRQESESHERLSATDISALASMKNVAKCDTWCELQNPVNHRVFERKLRPRPSGRGHACLGVTYRVARPPPLPLGDRWGVRAGDWPPVPPPCVEARSAQRQVPPCGDRHDEWWSKPPCH